MTRTIGVLLAFGLATGACSSEPSNPLAQVAGTYALRTINGQLLPYVWESTDPQNQVSFASGTVTLNEDGSFTDQTTFTVLVDGQSQDQPLDASGTWTLTGKTVTLVPDNGESYTFTWDGESRLSQMFDTLVLLYQKT